MTGLAAKPLLFRLGIGCPLTVLAVAISLAMLFNKFKRLDKNPGYLIDQTFYTVENTREDSWTDDSYMTQFEREK